MNLDILNIFLGFLEGLALILSPCILPIIPFILAGSLEGGRKRPFGIITGFVLAFALFTFFSRALVRYSGIDLLLVREVSYVLLFLFGIVMISTYLTEKFSLFTQRLMNVGSRFSNDTSGGFTSGVIFGVLVGLVWTPCAGPILAAVIVQSVLQQTSFGSFLIVLAFGIGAAIPMLLIALFGRTLMNKMTFVKTHTALIRKLLGVIVILSVIYMVYADAYPVYSSNKTTSANLGKNLINGLEVTYPAPDFAPTTEWINSQPLHISDLKGKVVLVDFWTYSCINCIRTFPYLKDWYDKYHDKGFEIIGVHTPEFEFEKNFDNVKYAVKTNGLKYPVVLDSNFGTWQNYHNRYWPAHYLIDKNGRVVYEHFGEGDYDITENNIRFLLGMNAVKAATTEPINYIPQTPETYFGYYRAENFAGSDDLVHDVTHTYQYPNQLATDQWALAGAWQDRSQYLLAEQPNASLKLHFNARKVFIVMGTATGFPINVKVLLNGQEVKSGKGKDVVNGIIKVDRNRLYEALNFQTSQEGIIEISALVPGLEVYTFTFGN